MKKIKFILFLCLIFGAFWVGLHFNKGEAYDSEMQNKYCPKKPFDISKVSTRNSSGNATGTNYLAEKIAETTVKKAFHSFAKGNISVKAKSFSVPDAKQGKFESFEIYANNIIVESVYISELWAKTVCGFVHFDLNSNPVKLKAPLLLDFSANFTEADLNKMLQAKDMNNSENQSEWFSLTNPKISLANDKFRFSIDVKVPFVRAFSFTTLSDLMIEDNKIQITNMQLGSTNNQLDVSILKYITSVFDPLSLAQKILEQYNCKLFLNSVKIQEGKIKVTGSVFIDKN